MGTSAAMTVGLLVFTTALVSSATALQGRQLLQDASAASAPGESGKLFDWGRPCTLLGTSSAVEITGPNNAACTPCGSGATATPEPTCTFSDLTFPVGSPINIFYHSSVHHLYLGDAACAFTTEICPNATADDIAKTKPCTYTFATAGKFFISDKAGEKGADDGGYCKDFGANLPVTVTTAA